MKSRKMTITEASFYVLPGIGLSLAVDLFIYKKFSILGIVLSLMFCFLSFALIRIAINVQKTKEQLKYLKGKKDGREEFFKICNSNKTNLS